MNRIQEAFEGYKTYVLLTFLVVAEVVSVFAFADIDIVAIRAIVLPLVGLTVNAKLNRDL